MELLSENQKQKTNLTLENKSLKNNFFLKKTFKRKQTQKNTN